MSLFSALNAAVSGLRAQSAQIAAVSENIANISTTAYKTRNLNFQSLVTGNGTGIPSGGVVFTSFQDIRAQGLLEATTIATNVAINGNGFFVVADDPAKQGSALNYSRNGSFQSDKDGNLINSEGYYLYGWATDTTGAVTAVNQNDLSSLQPINVESVTGSAQPTTLAEIDANIPADAIVGDIFQLSFEIFDSLGISHTVVSDVEKTAANQWTITLNQPVLTSNTSGAPSAEFVNAGVDDVPLVINFNGDGTMGSDVVTVASLATLADIEFDYTNGGGTAPNASGANASTILVDIGTAGSGDGLTQFASNSLNPAIEIDSVQQNGLRFGRLNEIQVSDDGLVFALFDNGLRQPIYQIPIATFSNPLGLAVVEGTVYDENQAIAGNFILNAPGLGAAGNLNASALELSTTDTSNEFNKMIVAQQGYSSSAQVISTSSDLFDTLIRAVS